MTKYRVWYCINCFTTVSVKDEIVVSESNIAREKGNKMDRNDPMWHVWTLGYIDRMVCCCEDPSFRHGEDIFQEMDVR